MRVLLRTLRLSPSFTATVLLTATLSIAAATLIFSIADPFLLRPMPYDPAGQVHYLWESDRKQTGAKTLSSPARVEEYRANLAGTFEAFSASYWDSMTLHATAGAAPVRVEAQRPLPGYFQVFPVQPALGRTFLPQEEVFGGPKAVVASHRFWVTHMQSDANAAGARIQLGADAYTVVGVLPPDFQYPNRAAELYVPAQLHPGAYRYREGGFLTVVGRVRSGVSADAARASAAHTFAKLQESDPQSIRGRNLNVVSLRTELVGSNTRLTLWTMLAAVGLVLLIACGNIAGLMVARAASKQREFAVRLALGGGPRDLFHRILGENLVLFGAAGVFGTLLAVWLVDALRTAPLPLPAFTTLRVDFRIVAFTLCVSLLTALAASLIPAFSQLRVDLQERLKQLGGRGATSGRQGIRRFIVAAEVALAMMLLVCSGLIGRSFLQLSNSDLGYATERRLTFMVSYSWEADRNIAYRFQQQVLDKLEALPDVEAAGMTNFLPLRSGMTTLRAHRSSDGGALPNPAQWPTVDVRTVSPGYFRAMGIPILAGQTLPGPAEKRLAVLVNQAYAKAYFPGEDPVGRTIRVHGGGTEAAEHTIVGVAGDTRNRDLSENARPTLYNSFHQNVWPVSSFVVVSKGSDPAILASSIRRVVQQADPNQAVSDLQTLPEIVNRDLVRPKLNMIVMAVFACAAMLLTGLGLYGVLAVTVAAQTREIGLRLALGAQARQIASWLMQGAGKLVLSGLAAGSIAGAIAARWLAANVYGANAADPLVWTSALALLTLTSTAALAIPALRAIRIAPTEALRDE